MKIIKVYFALLLMLSASVNLFGQTSTRKDFDQNWKFYLGDMPNAKAVNFNDTGWRNLNLPHDWSIELPFDSTSPTGTGGGALRGGIGWYRKSFTVPPASKGKNIFIDFDGVYMNSEVWINGHSLGIRPYGFSSFRYDLTPYLNYGSKANTVSVKVDNSQQPNSRWYSGSGIYRNVWLVTTNALFIDHWGTYITTPTITSDFAYVTLDATIANRTNLHDAVDTAESINVNTSIYDASGKKVTEAVEKDMLIIYNTQQLKQELIVNKPHLWSIEDPYLYKAVTRIIFRGKTIDTYTTSFGIRSFVFDADKGFLLNGKQVKINGVCDHHDLGCLGSAINTRALERQLEILKGMGCNGIRTSHNPPAPELLDLCDKMGFIVMDEAFDMWKMKKTKYDYHLYWDEWHTKDLQDMILRDRNHPSVFIWSIGNEIPEQEDTAGARIAIELASTIHAFDTTRPITSACDRPGPNNKIFSSGAVDLLGYNYHQYLYAGFQQLFPGKKFISTESVSALETRGHYDLIPPSDSIRRWPERWDKPFKEGNPDLTISAYDDVSAPWGSTHEETWKIIKKYPFLSGQFIWTGFDYIGEPTPYPWPARSSYFGIIDLTGFPKDIYYMYQSEWTDKTVLHIFPHWNWKAGDTVDVWAYYNHADEVELILNGKSLGTRSKTGDDLHVMWRVPYQPGTLKAISKKDGKIVMTQEIKTAGTPAKIVLIADRSVIRADGKDLSFVTVKIVDKNGNFMPVADNNIQFKVTGPGFIAGTDNGLQTSLESFKGSAHKAFNGLCLAVVQSSGKPGSIELTATSPGLETALVTIVVK